MTEKEKLARQSLNALYLELPESVASQHQQIVIEALEETKNLPPADEMWDDYSEHIDENIDALQTVAGTTVMRRSQFMKLFEKLKGCNVPVVASEILEKEQLQKLIVEAHVPLYKEGKPIYDDNVVKVIKAAFELGRNSDKGKLYTRSEVEQLCSEAYGAGMIKQININELPTPRVEFRNWVKENLK